ncbi:MAG: 8-amino-7-oxononanoate synthase [Prosthecobacter sp.]|nr:8-amino-7-oxononanoate synthase [Prosthecobacter sp.]
MSADPPEKEVPPEVRTWQLEPQIRDLRDQGLWRELRTVDSAQGPVIAHEGREYQNFSSNDYLGLAGSEALKAALHEGVERYGAGAGASRLVCGTLKPHVELEAALAVFKGCEAALTFSSGYAVALGTIPALMGAGDTLILDKLCHASLVDAARLSGATMRIFPHNQLGKLERLLQTATGRVLIVTESIFSMDGDACPLAEIVELKERHGAWLMLDEAHAVGVVGPQGRGLAAHLGLESKVELQMGTLSKAIGLSGGYLAASRQVVDLLINRARSFIYSTAPPPSIAHAAKAALDLVAGPEGEKRRQDLWRHIDLLKSRMQSPANTAAAILPLMVGDEAAAVAMSLHLREQGFLIPAIRYPTVARGKARLRITLSAAHETAQVERLAEAISAA